MFLQSLSIERFKKYHHLALTFTPGINLIKGRNEAGKSTLLEAILTTLFEDVRSSRQVLRDQVSWGREQMYRLNMEFQVDGQSFRLERDFAAQRQQLIKVATRETWEDKRRLSDMLRELTGFPSKQLFVSTACVRQNELSQISRGTGEIRQQLEAIVTGGGEGAMAQKIIDNLAKEIGDIRREGRVNPGRLQKIREEQKRSQDELRGVEEEVKAALQKRSLLAQVERALREKTKSFEERRAFLENAQKAFDENQRQKGLSRRFDELKRRLEGATKADKEIDELRRGREGQLRISPDDIERLKELRTHKGMMEREKEEVERSIQTLREERNGLSLSPPLPAFAGLVLFVSGVVGALAIAPWLWAVVLISLVLLVWGTGTWLRIRRRAREMDITMDGQEERLQSLQQRMAEPTTVIDETLRRYAVQTVDDLESTFRRSRSAEERLNAQEELLSGLLGDETKETLQEELRSATRELAVAEEKLQGLRPYMVNGQELIKLQREVRSLDEEVRRLQVNAGALAQFLKEARRGSDDLATLQERIESLQRREERIQQRLRVCELTREGIEEARRRAVGSVAQILEERVGKMMEEITRGRYERVKVDREDLSFRLFSPEKRDWVDLEKELSLGTRDQVYLVARLALIETIAGPGGSLLLLDDPFISFDDDRLVRAMDLLKRLSREHQMLLFTCHNFYDGWEDNRIELDKIA